MRLLIGGVAWSRQTWTGAGEVGPRSEGELWTSFFSSPTDVRFSRVSKVGDWLDCKPTDGSFPAIWDAFAYLG
jgi:hypothetical protein